MSDENNKPLDWDELSIMRALVSDKLRISFTGLISKMENTEGFGSIEKEVLIMECKGMTDAYNKVHSTIIKWSEQSVSLNHGFEFTTNDYQKNSRIIDEQLKSIINHISLVTPKD